MLKYALLHVDLNLNYLVFTCNGEREGKILVAQKVLFWPKPLQCVLTFSHITLPVLKCNLVHRVLQCQKFKVENTVPTKLRQLFSNNLQRENMHLCIQWNKLVQCKNTLAHDLQRTCISGSFLDLQNQKLPLLHSTLLFVEPHYLTILTFCAQQIQIHVLLVNNNQG